MPGPPVGEEAGCAEKFGCLFCIIMLIFAFYAMGRNGSRRLFTQDRTDPRPQSVERLDEAKPKVGGED